MVNGFVRECGGYPFIFSTKGEGTKVTLHTPYAEARLKDAQRAQGASQCRNSSVGLEDDDVEVWRFARRILAPLGHGVAKFGGVNLARRVRKTCSRLPILLITGSSEAAKRAANLEEAKTLVIQKPFRIDELDRALEAIGAHELRRSA
jgi:hypothetical protein